MHWCMCASRDTVISSIFHHFQCANFHNGGDGRRGGTGVMANVDKPQKHQNTMNICLAVKACVMGTPLCEWATFAHAERQIASRLLWKLSPPLSLTRHEATFFGGLQKPCINVCFDLSFKSIGIGVTINVRLPYLSTPFWELCSPSVPGDLLQRPHSSQCTPKLY